MTRQTKKKSDPFQEITWEDLEKWAGRKIVARGQNYQKRGYVEDLGKLGDGNIIASVQGTEYYATQVILAENKLSSQCTCPYGFHCKHAVAVILEYIDCLKNEKAVELVKDPKEDPRLMELEEEFGDDDLDEDEDAWLEEVHDDFDLPREVSRMSKSSRSEIELETFLKSKTQEELLSLCLEMAQAIPGVQQFILDKHTVASGSHTKIIAAIRKELAGLQDTQWDYSGFGDHSADLDRLKKHVDALAELGKFDELVHLGPEILEAGSRAIEHEHEGESSYAISDCLAVIFEILPNSSLEPVDQLVWAIDMELNDEYSLCEGFRSFVFEKQNRRETWSLLADELDERLANLEIPTSRSDFSKCYHRNKLGSWAAHALEKAGRNDEIISLYKKEAPITGSYERLVAHLIQLKQLKEAKQYCLEGIKELQAQSPGYAVRLYDQLENIYQSTKNHLQMAALIADEFFSRSDLDRFKKLIHVGKKLKQSEVLDVWARYFLETGIEPGKTGSSKSRNAPQDAWPLPKPEAPTRERRSRKNSPNFEVLIEIAIAEKKPQEIIKWYDMKQSKADGRFLYFRAPDDDVAEAIKSEYPKRAIQMWQAIAQGNINQISPKGYDAAEPFLKKIKKLMHQNKMHTDWKAYMAALRKENQRRPRCMQVLSRVANAGKPIVNTI